MKKGILLRTISALILAITIQTEGYSQNKKPFTFVQICDPQIRIGDDDSFFKTEGTVERYVQAIKRINALEPDFVVICGDLVQRSNDESFTAFRKIQGELNAPCYIAPGNHDYNPSRGDERATPERLQLYRKYFGDDYFTIEHNGWAFVIINTPLYLTKAGGDKWQVEPFEGSIEKEYNKQAEWLDKTLNGYKKKEMPIMLVAHHPLHPDMPGLAPGLLTVSLRTELFDLFKETGVRAVLGGHGHKVFIKDYDDISIVHAHTTSFILEQGPAKRDDFGFRLWHIHADGTFTHEYIPLEINKLK